MLISMQNVTHIFLKHFNLSKTRNFEDLNGDMNPLKRMPFRAMRVTVEGQGRENVNLENHHKNIDLHFFISGTEQVGYRSLDQSKNVKDAYKADRDIELFADQPLFWM